MSIGGPACRQIIFTEVSAETTDVKLTSGVSSGLENIPAFLTNEREYYAHEGLKAAINLSRMSLPGKRNTTLQGMPSALSSKELFTSNREFMGRWKNESAREGMPHCRFTDPVSPPIDQVRKGNESVTQNRSGKWISN